MPESKLCTRCGRLHPATSEFFYEDKSRLGKCTACKGFGSHNGRSCKRCKGTGDATTPALRSVCKKCTTEQVRASGWSSTPDALRKRKRIELTLSDEAQETLAAMAKGAGVSRSEMVEILIMEADEMSGR